MAQAASIHPVPVNICRARFTRLTSTGTIAAGPHNSYTTADIDHLNFTPQVNQGVQRVLVGGCNCVKATFKAPDSLLYFTFDLELAGLHPLLLEMLTGGGAILDSSDVPVGVGYQFPDAILCGQDAAYTAVEVWTDNWEQESQSAAPFQFTHWVFPMVSWQWGNGSLQNDFFTPTLSGTSRGNAAWGVGPYGDLPAAVVSAGGVGKQGGLFWTSTMPAVTDAYATASSG